MAKQTVSSLRRRVRILELALVMAQQEYTLDQGTGESAARAEQVVAEALAALRAMRPKLNKRERELCGL